MLAILKVTKYQLRSFRGSLIAFLLYMAAMLTINAGITQSVWSSSASFSSNAEITSFIWIFILGLIYFKPGFRFLLANGVSRRRFYWASMPTFAALAVFFAAGGLLFPLVFAVFRNAPLYQILYKRADLAGGTVWMLAALFFLVTLGWFIAMLYYRSGSMLKLVVSTAPFVLLYLFVLLNRVTGGLIARALAGFFTMAMGFSGAAPNPYLGALSLLLFAAVLWGFNYLLVRRAEIRD